MYDTINTMLQAFFQSPIAFFTSLFAIIAAVTIHEFAHAWAADRLGDPTPRLQGRLTLNPRAHLDPIGTLMLVLFRFGWGKPVQFDPFNLKNPRRDAMLIGLAGPASNILTAVMMALLLYVLPSTAVAIAFAVFVLHPFIVTSIVLALFNLVPVHPLDGGKIIAGLLPKELASEYEGIQRQWGTMLLLFLIFPWGGTSAVFYLIGPAIDFVLRILLPSS